MRSEERKKEKEEEKKKKKKKTTCVRESQRFDHGSQPCLFIYQNAMETQFA